MDLKKLDMLFTLAGFKFEDAISYANQFWPDEEQYKQQREDDPWWKVQTSRGHFEIGYRDQDIHLEWSDTGMVFPFVDPHGMARPGDIHVVKHEDGIESWETGCYPKSIGQVLDILTRLRMVTKRHDYLRGYWGSHPAPLRFCKEWVVKAERRGWQNKNGRFYKHLELVISAPNKTRALEQFHSNNPRYFVKSIDEKSFLESIIHHSDEVKEEVVNSEVKEKLAA